MTLIEQETNGAIISRQYSTITPQAVQIDDPTGTYDSPTQTYTVSFPPPAIGSYPIDSWQVNWGDGTTDTVPGNSSPIDYTYGSAPAGLTVTAAAYDASGKNLATFTLPEAGISNIIGSKVPGTNNADSIIVLDPTSSGSLSVNGRGTMIASGDVVVNSSSPSALTAVGNASLTANGFIIKGSGTGSDGVEIHGNNVTLNPSTWSEGSVADPLAARNLDSQIPSPGPGPYAEIDVTGGSHTIDPGTYASIHVGGTGSLTLNAGLYVILDGGFKVEGQGNVTGTGVTIVTTTSSFSVAGQGNINLSPPGTGTWAGVTVFQPTSNTGSVSITGKGVTGLGGTIYAPEGVVKVAGNGVLSMAIDAYQVQLTGKGEIIDGLVIGLQGNDFTATEGASTGDVTVASFYAVIDMGYADSVNDTKVNIDWGDGHSSEGWIQSNASGGYDIVGSHTYSEEGVNSSQISIELVSQGEATSTVTSTATISDAALTAGALTPPVAVEGQAFSNVPIFHFTDDDPNGVLGEYKATVNTGDATLDNRTNPDEVQIVSDGPDPTTDGFDVLLSHTYAEELKDQTFSVTVIDDEGGSGTLDVPRSTTGDSTSFSVADVPVAMTGGFTINAEAGVSFTNQTVATFTDPPGAEDLSEYSAAVDWRDGSAPVTLTGSAGPDGQLVESGGVFEVQGTHTYAAPGSYNISITVTHEQLPSSTTSTATIASALTLLYPPFFTSTPPTDVYIGSTYTYEATAKSPQNSPLTFSIVSTTVPSDSSHSGHLLTLTNDNPPDDMAQIAWTPSADEADQSYSVTIKVTDSNGQWAMQTVPIAVHETAGNHRPKIVSTPIESYQPIGSTTPATLALPATVRTFDPQISPEFQSGAYEDPNTQLGADGEPVFPTSPYPDFNNWYHDASGINTSYSYPLTMSYGQSDQLENHPDGYRFYAGDSAAWQPISGQSYYTVEAHGDFTYLTGKTYQIWGKSDDDLWVFVNGSLVLNNGGSHGATSQTVTLDTSNFQNGKVYSFDLFYCERTGGPAELDFQTNFQLFPLQDYQYNVRAIDPDNDPITYSIVPLADTPADMTINSTTGALTWNDPLAATGSYHVEVEASDGHGGTDTQTYPLTVEAWDDNTVPQITSLARTHAHVGQTYTYQVTATDPKGTSLVYQLLDGPAGMRIDPSGLVTWTPATSDLGTNPSVLLEVSSANGKSASQGYSIAVDQNLDPSPSFTSSPGMKAVSGSEYLYFATAEDPNNNPLTFDLPVHPDGMAVDDITGRVVWVPCDDQMGEQPVILRVTNDQGESKLQAFTIDVYLRPVFTSSPLPMIQGQPWQYQLTAMDPQNLPVTFSVPTKPLGMTFDSATNSLTWDNPQPGPWPGGSVQIIASATNGEAAAQQAYYVPVYDPADVSTSGPAITQIPGPTAYNSHRYISTVVATDPFSTDISYTLSAVTGSVPSDMTFDSQTGVLTWDSPVLGQSLDLRVTATDPYGSTSAEFHITVTAITNASSLTINSSPTQSAVVGQLYTYNATALNPDGSPLHWSLTQKPSGMVVNTLTGEVIWTPTADEVGIQDVDLKVINSIGGSSEQQFQIAVRGAPQPPEFLSSPVVVAGAGAAYTYQVQAVDPQGAKLRYSLNTHALDAGLTINPDSGLISGSVTSAVDVVVTVDDGQVDSQGQLVEATQPYTLQVTSGQPTAPPVFTSNPSQRATVSVPYTYTVTATTWDSSAPTYALLNGPQDGTFDSATHTFSWTPTAPGPIYILIQATDDLGAIRTQGYTLTAVENTPPKIISQAPTLALIGASQPYQYRVVGYQADGDGLSYSLDADSQSRNMMINASGIIWTPPSGSAGTYSVTVTVTDTVTGLTGTQSYPLNVQVNTQPPAVSVHLEPGAIPFAGSAIGVTVTAIPDTGVSITDRALGYRVNGSGDPLTPITLNGSGIGIGSVTISTAGCYDLVATATDSTGQIGTATETVYFNPAPSSPPSAVITSPAQTDNAAIDIGSATTFTGQVSTDSGTTYTWTAIPDAGGQTITLVPSTNVPAGGVVSCTVDPLTLANGSYTITLTATSSGGMASASEDADVHSITKLGNFSISFTDVTVPVAGIPITLTRSYDSLNANSQGDFGYGWTLDYRTAHLQISGTGNDGGFVDGQTKVWITLPGQKREEFQFAPQLFQGDGYNLFQGLTQNFTPVFAATGARNTDTLTIDQLPEDLWTIDGLPEGVGSELYDGGTTDPYDPRSGSFGLFHLTTKSGLSYDIDPSTGQVVSITNLSGNKVNFFDNAITASAPDGSLLAQITINRDTTPGATYNDIKTIIDPNGNQVIYGYDTTTGDLTSVAHEDASKNPITSVTLQYADAAHAHFLTGITDNNNVALLTVTYTPDGNLDTIQNANTDSSSFVTSSEVGGTVEMVTDGTGFQTINVYDGNGNVVRTLKQEDHSGDAAHAKWSITIFEYDANNNLTAQSLPFEAIASGDISVIYIAEPTGYSYSPGDDPNKINPDSVHQDWAQVNTYDPNTGDLLTSKDATGNTSQYTYNQYGEPRTITDALGNTTTNTYDDATGNLTKTVDPAGMTTNYGYTNGNLTSVSQVQPDGTILSLTTNTYSNGHLASTTDVVNNVTHYFLYDDSGNQTVSYSTWIDPSNSSNVETIATRTKYDADNRVIETDQYVLSGSQSFSDTASFDSYITAHGYTPTSTTSNRYNTQSGLLDKTFDQFGTETDSYYDKAGQIVQTRTQSRDASGNLVWQVTDTAYDAAGRVVATTDPYLTDTSGNRLTALSDMRITHTLYDGEGRPVQTRRLEGLTITIGGPDGNGCYTSSFTYDPSTDTYAGGTPAVNVMLSSTQTVYNANGTVAKTLTGTAYSGGVQTDPGIWTYYKYDDAGRQTDTIQAIDLNHDSTLDVTYDGDGVPNGGTEFIDNKQAYDADGRVAASTDVLGHVTTYQYDADGRVTKTIFDDGTSTSTKYDVLGRKIASIDQLGRETDYEYDDSGRLIAVTLPPIDPTGKATGTVDQRRPRYEYHYDQYGNQTEVVADLYLGTDGRVYYQHKDAAGNEISDGSRALNEAPLSGGQVTSYTYDYAGRQHSRTLPLGQTEWSFYDDTPIGSIPTGSLASSTGGGELAFTVDFQGRVTRYLYDNRNGSGGRVVEKDLFSSAGISISGTTTTAQLAAALTGSPDETVTYQTDALGRNVQTVDSASGTWNYQYDAEGRQTQVASTTAGTINYEYDSLGRLTRTYTSSTDTRYAYDELGRLYTVTLDTRGGVALSPPEVTSYYYDAVGNLKDVVQANGIVADYSYDDLNRLNDVTDFVDANNNRTLDSGETLAAEFTYILNTDGTRSQETDTQYVANYGDVQTVFTWGYDGLSRLVSEGWDDTYVDYSASYITVYTYDLASNRLTKQTAHDASGYYNPTYFSPDEIWTSAYDANDRLLSEKDDQIYYGGQDTYTAYSYGGAGNPWTMQTEKKVYSGLNDTGTVLSDTRFVYDDQGRMSQSTVTDNGTSTMTVTNYSYDPSGTRISQSTQINGGTVHTTADLVDQNNPTGYSQVLEERVDGTLTKTYTLGLDVIAQNDNTHGTLTLLYDGHGSTRALTDSSAAVVQRYAYDVYGKQLTDSVAYLTGAADAYTSLLYSGEQSDLTTGLQYLRGRYYDPSSGRFTESDPQGYGNNQDPISLHRYLYTPDDPLMYVDASGHDSYPYTSTNGIAAHLLFNVYVTAHGFTANPAAPLKELLPDEASLAGVMLAPDVVDLRGNHRNYYELKPITHYSSQFLQSRDALQMGAYDAVLQPLGFSRGDAQDISGEISTPIGYIEGDRGEVFLVTLYPQRDVMIPSNLDGRGLVLYSLTAVDPPDEFTAPKPVPVPVSRPVRILKPEERYTVPIGVLYGAATVTGLGAVYAFAGTSTGAVVVDALRGVIFAAIGTLTGELGLV